ncbi:MAG: glycosyltransferase [Actinobacteria bacterium]|nr:glycosyltransferase [Actinomycetota bacterium]
MLSSLIIPVYGNSETIAPLIEAIEGIERQVEGDLEVVFVIDGSPDDSETRLLAALPDSSLDARVVEHSRNFGSFAAIRTGMNVASGSRMAVMAADLQEPPGLVVEFLRRLATGDVDIVAGERASRDDRGDAAASLYWRLYKRFVLPEVPAGGVDVFACSAEVRDVICSLESVHTSLVAQLFWVGFRRELVAYDRLPSATPSGWTFRRKLRYLSDSVFAFTDLPVKALWMIGLVGLALGVVVALIVIVAKVFGSIHVPGYAPTILVVDFFGSLNLIGLGIIGSYVYRTYETAKGRPGAIVAHEIDIAKGGRDG